MRLSWRHSYPSVSIADRAAAAADKISIPQQHAVRQLYHDLLARLEPRASGLKPNRTFKLAEKDESDNSHFQVGIPGSDSSPVADTHVRSMVIARQLSSTAAATTVTTSAIPDTTSATTSAVSIPTSLPSVPSTASVVGTISSSDSVPVISTTPCVSSTVSISGTSRATSSSPPPPPSSSTVTTTSTTHEDRNDISTSLISTQPIQDPPVTTIGTSTAPPETATVATTAQLPMSFTSVADPIQSITSSETQHQSHGFIDTGHSTKREPLTTPTPVTSALVPETPTVVKSQTTPKNPATDSTEQTVTSSAPPIVTTASKQPFTTEGTPTKTIAAQPQSTSAVGQQATPTTSGIQSQGFLDTGRPSRTIASVTDSAASSENTTTEQEPTPTSQKEPETTSQHKPEATSQQPAATPTAPTTSAVDSSDAQPTVTVGVSAQTSSSVSGALTKGKSPATVLTNGLPDTGHTSVKGHGTVGTPTNPASSISTSVVPATGNSSGSGGTNSGSGTGLDSSSNISGSKHTGTIAGSVLGAFFILLIIAFLCFWVWRKRRGAHDIESLSYNAVPMRGIVHHNEPNQDQDTPQQRTVGLPAVVPTAAETTEVNTGRPVSIITSPSQTSLSSQRDPALRNSYLFLDSGAHSSYESSSLNFVNEDPFADPFKVFVARETPGNQMDMLSTNLRSVSTSSWNRVSSTSTSSGGRVQLGFAI